VREDEEFKRTGARTGGFAYIRKYVQYANLWRGVGNEKSSCSTIRIRQLLTPLIDKPPYISGTLQLCFTLFYKVTKDDHAARFDP
jgi:hypothetical protein